MNPAVQHRRQVGLGSIVALVFFGVVILRAGWISDDAYITLRTVDNFVNGYGLTWNPTERVQGFTHPLWMFALSALYAITREAYFTTIILAVGVSLAAVWLLATRIATSERAALLGLVMLTLSRAFVDYATSGLENPLTHLLLVAFFIVYFERPPSLGKLAALSMIASLGGANRLDTLAIYLPALLFTFVRTGPSLKAVGLAVVGQAPLILWTLFSYFYYGFPFPNTAYAKLNTGIPAIERTRQGLVYLLDGLLYDPLTLLVIATGIALVVARRKWRAVAAAGGALLYLLYIVRIGGDFMSGRFFTAPLLVSVILISRHRLEHLSIGTYAVILLAVLALGLSPSYPTLVLGTLDYEEISADATLRETGIADEALFYARDLGLANAQRGVPVPQHPWREQGEQLRAGEKRVVVRDKSTGLYGYYAGPNVHIVDRLALTDPLLARLPAKRVVVWRPGHFERVIPDGYLETLRFRRDAFADRDLGRYYEKLAYITRGPLWAPRRWLEILKMNLGAYDDLIDVDAYRYPAMVHVNADELSAFRPEGTELDAEGVVHVQASGLEVDLSDVVRAPRIELSLDRDDDYEVTYYLGSRRVARQVVRAKRYPWEGLALYVEEVPRRARRRGYDRLRLQPLSGEAPYAVGHLAFHDPERWVACSRQSHCTLAFDDPDTYWLLQRGWANPEDWGRWNLGPQSSLVLYTEPRRAYQLDVEAFPLEVEQRCDQTLRLWWNDLYLGERAFGPCDGQLLSFSVPASAVERKNELRFVYRQVYNPVAGEATLPGETRPLGVGFVALHLRPR